MTKKQLPVKKKRSFWFHLALLFVVSGLLYLLLFASLGLLTNHNEEVKMPVLIGKDLKVVMAELQQYGFDVAVDSAYEPEARPMTVLTQQPDTSSVVKRGRIVFLTVNKAEPPLTAMPNLIGLSYRSAVSLLTSNRLLVGDTTYKPDIAKGAVLEQLFRGKSLEAGGTVPQGSRIDLVIGDGLGDTEMQVPDIIGQSYLEAMAIIGALGLQPNLVFDRGITDSFSAVVYNQHPKPMIDPLTQNTIREGEIIDVFIKQDPDPQELERNRLIQPDVYRDGTE